MIRVLNTEVERNSKIKTNLVYFIYLITTNLFRMAGKACHTHQVIVASDDVMSTHVACHTHQVIVASDDVMSSCRLIR